MKNNLISAAVRVALGSVLLAGVAVNGYAATATADLSVSATVAASCTLTATTSISFGAYNGTQNDANGTLTYNCTNGTTVTSLLAEGPAPTMTDGATTPHLLDYSLYSDSAGGTPWTNTAGPTITPDGTDQTITVYGRIPAAQSLYVGSYTDTNTFTLTY